MTNIENTNNETPDAYSDIFSFFSATSIGILYQLSPFLLSKENQALLDELVGKAKVELIGFLDRAESRVALGQQIEQWRNQKADPKQTRVIIKIINNTSHTSRWREPVCRCANQSVSRSNLSHKKKQPSNRSSLTLTRTLGRKTKSCSINL